MTKLQTNVVLLFKCQMLDHWQVIEPLLREDKRCSLFTCDENGSIDQSLITRFLSENDGIRYVCHVPNWYDVQHMRKTCLKRPACVVIETVDQLGPMNDYVSYQLAMCDGLQKRLDTLIENIYSLVRPEWDTYFLHLAQLVSTRANCRKRRVGAVVVKDRRIVSTGYNGTPTGSVNCLDGGCERCLDISVREGEKLQSCVCLHAETNAIIEAGRDRVKGGTLFVTCIPCLDCSKTIIQAGIRRVVYLSTYGDPTTTFKLFANSSVEVEPGSLYPCGFELAEEMVTSSHNH